MFCRKIFEDWRRAVGWITIAIFTVAIIFSIFLITLMVRVSKDDPNSMNVISVNGTGEVVVIPDVATFNFSVVESGESVEVAQNIASTKIDKAITYLKENGIEEDDIKTEGYNVNPKYEWISENCTGRICPPGKQKLVGYEVNQSTSVKVRDTSKAGEILSSIGEKGVSYISGLSFTTDDPDALKEQARNAAIADAKAKADSLSENLDVKLVKIIGFSEDFGRPAYGGSDSYGGIAESKAVMIAPEISPGEQTITSTVYITYKIR